MTRKTLIDYYSDEELQSAQNDLDILVHYNHDGSYNIEYATPLSPNETPVIPKHVDYSDKIYNIHKKLSEYCAMQSLPFIANYNSCAKFGELVYQYVGGDSAISPPQYKKDISTTPSAPPTSPASTDDDSSILI